MKLPVVLVKTFAALVRGLKYLILELEQIGERYAGDGRPVER